MSDEHSQLEDAVTPISGAHSVPRSARPGAGRRLTAMLPRKNWQGVGIVFSAVLLFAVALVGFLVWKGPPAKTHPKTRTTDDADSRPHNHAESNKSNSEE